MTGFGAFLEVAKNPSAALAEALDGQAVGECVIVGRVLEVSYAGGIEEAVRLADAMAPRLIVGFGVSRRGGLRVERTGRARLAETPDVLGACPPRLEGPEEVRATADVETLAEALDCLVSDDAGAYVCNAWLHQLSTRAAAPCAFVHVPPEGVAPERVLRALGALEDAMRARHRYG